MHVTGAADNDEESPPPLPQRTPESYILAADAGRFSASSRRDCDTCDLFFVITRINVDILCYAACAFVQTFPGPSDDACDRLAVIIPSNAAAQAVRELQRERQMTEQ